jgi:hypothetical protein
MIKAIYAWHGEDTFVDRCRKHSINRILFAANDAQKFQIDHAFQNGFSVGLYTNPQWYGYPEAKVYRKTVADALARLTPTGKTLSVQFNNERHDPLYMLAILFWYRRQFQGRETSWCFEGRQGGWVGPMFRTKYAYTHPDIGTVQLGPDLLTNVEMVPQCYDGSMKPYDPFDTVKDLVDWGVPFNSITPMVGGEYANQHSRGADQYYYLQSRLP